MEKRDVVIIGGGPAGRTIVHMLHAAKCGLSITVIKDEKVNVNRCAVPFGINTRKPLEKFQISNKLVTDFGAELVVDRVEKIDTAEKRVDTEGGRSFEYRHLVLATGSRPMVPPIPGIDAEIITPVRSLSDLERLRDLASKGKRAVVVGGGYIGIEIALVLQQAGIDVVTGSSEVLDKYPMMDEVDYIRTKLFFNRENQKLIGGCVMRKGNSAAQNVDFISFAIQMGATMDDLLTYQYCTHPELAAKPSDNSCTFAARDARSKL